ncbi:hypothetical protein [Burkholderia vietnamiensis]|uniref:hypothetical protein n=1 Tax=Burkholderia vietnamiensis TaxID=60552 RepID=UPI00159332EF|nr:hypothetical protein [Burkholderia vietnamiensis]
MATATLTLQDLFAKVQNGTATADDYAELAKLSKAKADAQKQAEAQAKTLIATIKDAKIEPQILTNLLAQEGLIILPKSATTETKVVIVEEAITTKEGRSSTFKVWKGRDCKALTADAKNYWTALKGKGKDYFIGKLNAEGKAYYETDEGKKYIDGLFAQ